MDLSGIHRINTQLVDQEHRKAGWVRPPNGYGAPITNAIAAPFDKMWASVENKRIELDAYLIELLETLEEELIEKLCQTTAKWCSAESKIRDSTLRKINSSPVCGSLSLDFSDVEIITIEMAANSVTDEMKALFDELHAFVSNFVLADENDKTQKFVFLELSLLERNTKKSVASLVRGWK